MDNRVRINITFRVEPEFRERLRKAAKEAGRSVANYVQWLVNKEHSDV